MIYNLDDDRRCPCGCEDPPDGDDDSDTEDGVAS